MRMGGEMTKQPGKAAVKHAKFVFLDTAYANALINTRDQWHERAVVWRLAGTVSKRKTTLAIHRVYFSGNRGWTCSSSVPQTSRADD